MPKSFQQKLKILYLMRVFSEKTDEAHPMSVKDLISYLESLGIHAERKTIYDDIETLRVFGMDIMNRRERPSGFYLASREFETAELKLLVDAVQSSRFLTVGKSRQLIQKLEHLTSIYQAKDLQRQAIVLDQVKNTNESIYYNVDEIHRAISQNRQISFQYTEWTVSKERHLKKGGARYQISPWQMIWQDGNYYLIGVDEKSGIVKKPGLAKLQYANACCSESDCRYCSSGEEYTDHASSAPAYLKGTIMERVTAPDIQIQKTAADATYKMRFFYEGLRTVYSSTSW